jgi:hypothetical protein
MATVRSPQLGSAQLASVLNALAGIWLIISPFLLGFMTSPAALWATLIPGVVVLVLAWIRAANPANNVGLGWINLIAGIWSIIAPWVCLYSTLRMPTTNNVIVGIIVGILAIWSAAAAGADRGLTQ